jgi:transposase
MENDPNKFPDDIEQCHAMLAEMAQELKQLHRIVAHLLRARYGPKAEKLDENQLVLFAGELLGKHSDVPLVPPEAPEPKQKVTPHGRQRLPEHLPRKQVVYDLPEGERQCPQCHGDLKRIGEEVSERLEFIPASLHVLQEVCPKYACEKGCTVVTAQKPMQPIEKGLPGPGLLAHIVVSKYADHLPLYRQERMFEREGVKLSRSTMGDWMGRCAELVSPLYELLKERVLFSKVMQTDDTPVGVLDRSLWRTRTGRIWTYVGDKDHPFTVYDYTPNRSRDGPVKFMKGFNGKLQADAYSGYEVLYEDEQRDVTEVACWAHARRKFYDAQSSDIMRSMVMLGYTRLLYDVEREAKKSNMDADGRLALRQVKSVPILNDIKAYLERERPNVLPKSPEGQAISYVLSNWEALRRYSEDGDLEIDNNGAERSLRGVAVGRKNWLFFGSDNGGRTAAILTSFTTTCKRLQINPFTYLRDVFDRISAHPITDNYITNVLYLGPEVRNYETFWEPRATATTPRASHRVVASRESPGRGGPQAWRGPTEREAMEGGL